MSDKVRVVILNYNQPSITAECVNKVLLQNYDLLEVVVVDNASRPENYKALEALLPENVTLIGNPANTGYAAGNNVGARFIGKCPKPSFIMILNNDAFLKDELTIQKLINVFSYDKGRVAVSPLVYNPESVKQAAQVRRDVDYLSCVVSGSWWLRRLPFFKRIDALHVYADVRPYAADREYDCDSINGACFMIRADFLQEIGYFDEGTFLYFEELVLGRQIKNSGKKCCLVTSVSVDHYQGSNTKQQFGFMSFKMYKEYIKSQKFYCKKYLGTGRLGLGLLELVRLFDYCTKRLIIGLYNRICR